MGELIKADIRYVAQRLPRDVREMLSANPGRLFVGGGFIRATIAGEEPSDIDIFGVDETMLEAQAKELQARRGLDCKLHTTKNAITVIAPDRLPVQFITRWTFPCDPTKAFAYVGAQQSAMACCRSFDFTVCQAVLWRGGHQSNDPWLTEVGDRFYVDLAARRLVYTSPVREEEAGGSMLRVIKYVKRGYTIQVASLGAVMARMTDKIDTARAAMTPVDDEPVPHLTTAMVLTGMLREVDPLLVVDGCEIVDDHEPVDGAENG